MPFIVSMMTMEIFFTRQYIASGCSMRVSVQGTGLNSRVFAEEEGYAIHRECDRYVD